jgi:diguanylate cyclase (GGDEF)-like protein
MADLEALEVLQKVEAKALLDAEPVMRQHLETQNTQVAQTELKMLGALKMRANAMLNDIQTAQSRRTTAGAIQQEEQRIVKDRMDLQQRVNKSLLKLEDLERQSAAIESVQKREAIDSNTEAELIKEGYAKRTSTDQLVVLPKGKRAVKELNRQARGLKGRLEAGYLGTERRNSVNAVKREMVDSLGPAQREVELYQDTLTGAQNRRAFNERQENIDVREGNEKTEVEGAQPAVAAVDVDSLAWVNDNMSHSAGDRLLLAVADAIGEQEGVEVFRLGGDEFAVTGTSEEALETALQAAAKQLGDTEITAGEDAVTPQITWGKGKNYEAADAQAISMKEDRVARGKIAGRKKKAATYKHRKQQGLFQKEDLPKSWSRVSKMIERGDNVEILTPDGAVQGTVTNVSRKRSRARVKVVAQGRSFTFNPESNHLIVSPTLSPEDLAWITGDYEYADPERETLPQTLS